MSAAAHGMRQRMCGMDCCSTRDAAAHVRMHCCSTRDAAAPVRHALLHAAPFFVLKSFLVQVWLGLLGWPSGWKHGERRQERRRAGSSGDVGAWHMARHRSCSDRSLSLCCRRCAWSSATDVVCGSARVAVSLGK
eukprot:353454-Chlamydomonas_euryale.AAC.4